MEKVFLLSMCAFCFVVKSMETEDLKLGAGKTRLTSIETAYDQDFAKEKRTIDEKKSSSGAILSAITPKIIPFGAPWLDSDPSTKHIGGFDFPKAHIYDGADASSIFVRKVDWGGFLNYFFPNAGFQGVYNLLSGAFGNAQGGNATFGDVGGYVPGVWEFFFSIHQKIAKSGLLFRPQWGFYNLWRDAKKTKEVRISNAPDCYMRIYYRQADRSLNFTGAKYVGIPVSFHNAAGDLSTMYVSGPTHELPAVVQASDSFVIVHRTIYRFGGPDPNNNKVIYGVLVQYSEADLAEFNRLCDEKKHLFEILKEAPLIKDSTHLLTILGVIL